MHRQIPLPKNVFYSVCYLQLFFIFVYICGIYRGYPYLVLSNDSHGHYMSIDLMITSLLAPLAEELVFRKILTEVIFPQNLKVSLLITEILSRLSQFLWR